MSGSLLVSLAIAAQSSQAQTPVRRLSDWMLEQPFTPDAYSLGLSWRVPGEVPVQHALRQSLLQQLTRVNDGDSAASRIRLRNWLASLPITGRVPVAIADIRWLQANPMRDPLLLSGHSVDWPRRPTTITVITGNGNRCAVTHIQGYEAKAYLNACAAPNASTADWAWIAQPDGRLQRYGVAVWNREAQDEPAPGAWIWAPPRNGRWSDGWSEDFSGQLITFLATQGPAPDPLQAPAPAPRANLNAPSTAAIAKKRQAPSAGGASAGFRVPLPDHAPVPVRGVPPPTAVSVGVGAGAGAGASNGAVTRIPLSERPDKSRSTDISSSDWGNVGLLQTPTARMYNAGHLSFSFSRTQPYTRGNIFFQPLDWLEMGFRYIDISNRPYDPTGTLFTTQSNKDKSVDFKARLWAESAYLPQIAVGIRDAAGTGLFSGEYLVANKRTGMLDWSLGLGWGYLAGQSRTTAFGLGGTFSVKNYFQGTAKPFGGVQYHTPLEKVTLKLEYEGNNYQSEPLANNQKRTSPWNFGVLFKVAKSVDITLGMERGKTAMLGIAFHTQLDGLSTPKVNDSPRVPVTVARPQPQTTDWAATTQAIQAQSGWQVGRIESGNRELHVVLDDAGSTYWRDRVDKIAAVLHRDAPASVDRFVLKYRARGIDIAEHVIDRDAWVRPYEAPIPTREQQDAIIARAPAKPAEPATVVHTNPRLKFEHNFRLGFGQTLGGPDGFVLFQVYAQEQARLWLRDDTWIDGSLRLRLADNYNKFKFDGTSSQPRVRTHLREYLTTARLTIPNLQITHAGKLSDNQYYSVYGGYLEEMFAGVGGEWLYRPFASRLAFGIDANLVKQRDFRQDLGFRNAATQTGYRTATGHGTLYWDTGWNDIMATLSVGRYLAKDSGATLQLARTFQNGVTVGAFATKTNVSAAQFGEGSFDKGLFLSIPYDAILSRSTGTTASWVWKPLTRDGGAFLARSSSLYGMTRARSNKALETTPAPLANDTLPPAKQTPQWTPKSTGTEPYTRVTQRPSATQFESGSAHEFRMTEALHRQGYRNVTISYNLSNQLLITLSNDTITPLSRAVGRAARTVLPLAPLETREIKITLAARTDALVTYEFFDVARLSRYFAGALGATELANYVTVNYPNPAAQEKNPLAQLDDPDPAVKAPLFSAIAPETVSMGRVANDFANAGRTALDMNWMQMGAVGASALLASSAADKRAFQFAKDHQNNRWIKDGNKVGNALPWVGLAGAALVALDGSDPKRSRTGFAATEAGMSALLLSTGLKYAVGRARPEDGRGPHSFNSFSSGNNNSALPSRHTAVAWAVATPFALEYDAPWLYGVAALSNLSRVGSREHWVSDTVAGSLLGYGLGRLFWESSRPDNRYAPRVALSRNGITLAWDLE